MKVDESAGFVAGTLRVPSAPESARGACLLLVGTDWKPVLRRRSAMNRSTALLAERPVSETAGNAGRRTVSNDQCFSYCAPSATHRFSMSFCPAVSVLRLSGGGI